MTNTYTSIKFATMTKLNPKTEKTETILAKVDSYFDKMISLQKCNLK